MPGIDPNIVVHDINTYPGAKPIRHRLRPVHPCKVVAIKLKVEKLLIDGFFYPMDLTDWVFNLVLVMKKQGVITPRVTPRLQMGVIQVTLNLFLSGLKFYNDL
jgi:hypothetical protein